MSKGQELTQLPGNLPENLRGGVLRISKSNRSAMVAGFASGDIDGDLAQERNTEPGGFPFTAATAKNIVALVVRRAQEIAHVLNQSKDSYVHTGKHGCRLARINERDLLWGGDDDGAGEGDGLDDGELDIAGAG